MKLTRQYLQSNFEDLENLTELDLSHNGITEIELGSFSNLTKLESIDLSHNNITHIHKNIFDSLPNLEEIRLYYNQLTDSDDATFKYLYQRKGMSATSSLPRSNFLKIYMEKRDVNKSLDDIFLNLVKNKPSNIIRVHDIISNYQNLEEIKKLYPNENQFYNLFLSDLNASSNSQLIYMATRIQNLLNLISLNFFNGDKQHQLEQIMYASNQKLNRIQSKIRINILSKKKELPLEVLDNIGQFGGKFEKKYLKYMQKYDTLSKNY